MTFPKIRWLKDRMPDFLRSVISKAPSYPAPRQTGSVATNTLVATIRVLNSEGNETQSLTRNLHTGDFVTFEFKDGSKIIITPTDNVELS